MFDLIMNSSLIYRRPQPFLGGTLLPIISRAALTPINKSSKSQVAHYSVSRRFIFPSAVATKD